MYTRTLKLIEIELRDLYKVKIQLEILKGEDWNGQDMYGEWNGIDKLKGFWKINLREEERWEDRDYDGWMELKEI